MARGNTTILDLFQLAKIDLTKAELGFESYRSLNWEYELSPRDFLNFAKEDFKEGTKKGNINALTNAKRAIDCQTGKIIQSLSIDPDKFPKAAKDFVNKFDTSPIKDDLTFGLRFLRGINFSPPSIVAKSRTPRNKLEHFYIRPTDGEVSDAVELAELFIMATESKLTRFSDFAVYNASHDCYGVVRFGYPHGGEFEVQVEIKGKRVSKTTVSINDIEYYYLVRIAASYHDKGGAKGAMLDLLDAIKHPMPLKHISIEISE